MIVDEGEARCWLKTPFRLRIRQRTRDLRMKYLRCRIHDPSSRSNTTSNATRQWDTWTAWGRTGNEIWNTRQKATFIKPNHLQDALSGNSSCVWKWVEVNNTRPYWEYTTEAVTASMVSVWWLYCMASSLSKVQIDQPDICIQTPLSTSPNQSETTSQTCSNIRQASLNQPGVLYRQASLKPARYRSWTGI